jgi:hypothetical protein
MLLSSLADHVPPSVPHSCYRCFQARRFFASRCSRHISLVKAVEDPIKRLFVEKIKDYQKAKPKNDNLKRVVASIKQTLEASK